MLALEQSKTLSEKSERAIDGTQAIEHLPSKHKVMSSNPTTAKKKKKKKKEEKEKLIKES
jgi:hypothetical protein